MFKVLFAKQKKLPWKPKKDRGAKPCLSRFPRELRVRCFARDARPYSTERSAPIPGSNPASKTGRVLSHSSIRISLYVIKTIKAISFLTSPQVRAYFLSFMGRNQFKKSSLAPPEKSEAEEVHQGKGVPFQHALHTFDTPCTLRCTPKVRHSVQAISRVHGLSRCFLASLHAMHTFFPMTYIYASEV